MEDLLKKLLISIISRGNLLFFRTFPRLIATISSNYYVLNSQKPVAISPFYRDYDRFLA